MTVGQKIKRLREDRNLSQNDVAKQANVSRSWISRVESDDIPGPDPKMLRAIARPLQVNPDELLSAAGYLAAPTSIDDMSLDDLFAEIERFNAAVRRRVGRDINDDTTQKKTTLIERAKTYSFAQ